MMDGNGPPRPSERLLTIRLARRLSGRLAPPLRTIGLFALAPFMIIEAAIRGGAANDRDS